MGPNTKRALQKRWDSDTRFQKFCAEELQAQRSTQLHILAELRKLSGLLETSLGQTHSDLEAGKGDINALQRQTQEHVRKLAVR
jgi:hypothetical protein